MTPATKAAPFREGIAPGRPIRSCRPFAGERIARSLGDAQILAAIRARHQAEAQRVRRLNRAVEWLALAVATFATVYFAAHLLAALAEGGLL